MKRGDKYFYQLHKGAWSSTQLQAAQLRQIETEAEEKLWSYLRNRQLKGKKFRRQHPIHKYILDFYCHECRLAIELDGGIHDNKEIAAYYEERTKVLNDLGVKVIRFRNEEVIAAIGSVLKRIGDEM